ncbi:ComEC/Rec2 family competence protein [Gracilibacillus kekensis]|uniref:Metal-dependent hydrolase, beta-lactamase superfamily II n=1 Tax=Gracilibacillus kekensis TaxID=1027249 RepID=A0A1M7PPN4_9BACI|nr:hydrolase [Gracilibacillus kekensis]SHN19242.1 Metal-dependent hydrolase, beta-lactamase superfamily II [Gracilibacillus kekensis]
MRRLTILLSTIFLSYLILIKSVSAIPDIPELQSDQLDIIFFNVPHGEASLIKNNRGEHILVNTASKRSQKTLYQQLSKLQVDQIDTIIITNQSEEYTGNLLYFLEHYQVNNIIIPNHMNESFSEDLNVNKWTMDSEVELWEDLYIQTLDQTKDGDISFLMGYGKQSILFLNDKDIAIEQKLINQTVNVDILKVAAFGSGHSPSQEFLEHIDPYMSIIFPSQTHKINESLIERLNATWIDVYFLKQSGTVFVRLSKDDYEILTENSSVS